MTLASSLVAMAPAWPPLAFLLCVGVGLFVVRSSPDTPMANLITLITLLFTLPSGGQLVTVDPSQGADSVMIECEGGQAIRQLSTARLYFNPVTGGGWRRISEHGVSGREGQPDSFVVDRGPGGHYYVTTTNPVGESCASPSVYVPGLVVTGIVPTEAEGNPITSIRTFDVQGRLVLKIGRSGIYFRRTTYQSGQVTTKKFVHLK